MTGGKVAPAMSCPFIVKPTFPGNAPTRTPPDRSQQPAEPAALFPESSLHFRLILLDSGMLFRYNIYITWLNGYFE
jgi:hypothetical protein